MTKAVKAVILARVSTKDQEEGYSIDAQTHRLQEYCKRKNLTILETFKIIESSTISNRKEFLEVIKYVKKQKEPIAIIADKVDRVQRSFQEYPLLNTMIQEGKIELHFNTEGYIIHKDSVSQERLMWNIGVVMAQSYVDSLRDNVNRSIAQKLRGGEWVSTARSAIFMSKKRAEAISLWIWSARLLCARFLNIMLAAITRWPSW